MIVEGIVLAVMHASFVVNFLQTDHRLVAVRSTVQGWHDAPARSRRTIHWVSIDVIALGGVSEGTRLMTQELKRVERD